MFLFFSRENVLTEIVVETFPLGEKMRRIGK